MSKASECGLADVVANPFTLVSWLIRDLYGIVLYEILPCLSLKTASINLFLFLFIAERRQSIGFDWHRECLKCNECGKVLNPGQHAEVSLDIMCCDD